MSQQGSNPSQESGVSKEKEKSIIKEEASVPMTEIQLSEVSEDYNPLTPPRCGGVKGKVFWCGGGMLSASKHHPPRAHSVIALMTSRVPARLKKAANKASEKPSGSTLMRRSPRLP